MGSLRRLQYRRRGRVGRLALSLRFGPSGAVGLAGGPVRLRPLSRHSAKGNDNVVNLRGGVALTERIALEGGYAFESFVAPNDFYDRQLHRANARMIFDVTSSLQLALGYSYQEGDVISYAVPPRPDIARFSIEREDQDEFGQPLRTAYKLLGRTHALSFSAAYQLTKHASVQLGYEYAITTHDPLEYEKHLVEVKIAVAY